MDLFCKNNYLNPLHCLVCHGFGPQGSISALPVEENIMEMDRSHRVIHGQNPALRRTPPTQRKFLKPQGSFLLLCLFSYTCSAHQGGSWTALHGKGESVRRSFLRFPFFSKFLLLIYYYLFISLHSFHSTKNPEGKPATDTG